MKSIIAIVAGGDSSEVVVSLKSAAGLLSFMDQDKYQVYQVTLTKEAWVVNIAENEQIEINRSDFSFIYQGKKIKFDFAYITIHGTPGEDGILQGYFDLIGVPYSTCGVLASALTFNKFTCNQYLKSFGVKVSESVLLRSGQTISTDEVEKKTGFPCFVKPNVGGSSFGVTKVKSEEDVQPAIERAFKEGNEVMIEAFMQGTEITCGIYKTKGKSVVLPITEVVPYNEFFDFDAKYKGQVEEITPARISSELTKRVQKLTSAIYDILGCKGVIRIDYIITEGDVINLLEVNTTPGMTTTSFIPQQVRAAGLQMKDVLTDIIENELDKRK
ncbi:D-alanine--D-alanine ligase [bioreactor metagenome]|jgi:D-alanine-D-alanine ligase|uniref:D-alanine--D-alanine ligase n=1 Tax=bioreactor metagenome TaxID=1076179 RepID=A0A644UZ66_9ZZZZ|nr:D-alanine--D-alanine ligase [Paludibacter sp.]